MSAEPRGPTTEELRARVLAAERTVELLRERGLDALHDPDARQSLAGSIARVEAFADALPRPRTTGGFDVAPVTLDKLDEYERKVLASFEEGYEYLVLLIPSRADVNDFAAGAALADLKKKKLVAFDGRGNMRSVYLTDEGEALRRELTEEGPST